jgi:ParB family chromosome partitioning protein
MTDEESAAHTTLLEEYRALDEEYPDRDEYPEEIDARFGHLEMAMEVLQQQLLIYETAEVARAGIFVTLDRDGSLTVHRGYVRAEDELCKETAVQEDDGAAAMGQGVTSSIPAGNRQNRPRGDYHYLRWATDRL